MATTRHRRGLLLLYLMYTCATVLRAHDLDDVYPEDHVGENTLRYRGSDYQAFEEEYTEKDEETGGALGIHTKGKMAANLLNVDECEMIKKIRCEDHEPDVVYVAIDEGTDIIEVGMILFGGVEWGCPSVVNDRPWDGLLRKVRSVSQRTPTVLAVDTEPARYMDLYEHAHMKYHYTPGERNNPVKKRRKRDCSGDDEGGQSVAQWITTIDEDISTDPGAPMEVSDTQTVEWSSPNPDVPYSFTCEDCNVNMTFGLEFQLEKPQDDPVTHYNLRLFGDLSVSQTVKTVIETTIAKAGTFKSPDIVEFPGLASIPFKSPPEAGLPDMVCNISATLWYEGMVDAKGKIGQTITTQAGYDGAFDLNMDITDGSRSEPVYTFTYTPGSSMAEITEMDIKGRANIGLVMYPVIQVKVSIVWAYRENLHWFDVDDKFNVMPKLQASHQAVVEDSIVCLNTLMTGLFSVSNDDVKIDVTIFANPAGFWREDLNSFDKDYDEIVMTEVEATCSVEEGCCRVDCFGPTETPQDNNDPMATVVGETGMIPEPDLLEVKAGAQFVLLGSKAKFTGRFALFLLKLIKFVGAYREGSKLLLKVGYDINTPVYNEGRAAWVQMSGADSPGADSDPAILEKLAQLAVCVGFEYAKVKAAGVEIGAKALAPPSSSRAQFDKTIETTAVNIDVALCDQWASLFPELSVGGSNPAGVTAIDVCGGVDDPISRMEPDSFAGFYCYQHADVSQQDEESAAAWCLSDSRLCFPCAPGATEPYKYCADCVMSAYMAFCLRRWATLVNAEGGSLEITDAWTEPHADRTLFTDHNGEAKSLNSEGRAMYVTVSGLGIGRASALAACASFDFVEVIDASTLYLAVRKASRDGLDRVSFVSNSLIAVDTPVTTDNYDVDTELRSEQRQVPLFDSHGVEGLALAKGFYVRDFLYPKDVNRTEFIRYFRLDNNLVYCLDLIQGNTPSTFTIKTAYKPVERNLYGADERHPKELKRYVNGQAVEICYPELSAGEEALKEYVDLGKRFLRRCSPYVRASNQGVGVGVYMDHLYVHLYENPDLNGQVVSEHWLDPALNETIDNKEVEEMEDAFERIHWQLNHGGPEIQPMNEQRICNNHPLAQGGQIPWKGFMAYRLAFDRPECQTDEWDEFCTSTEATREEIFQKVKAEILAMVQPDNRLHEYFFQGLKGCFLQNCGKCAGDGPVWAAKVHNCTDVARFFFQETTHDSFDNNFNFFNDDTLDEDFRDMVCGAPEQLCPQKTSAWSILAEVLETLYVPGDDPTVDVEEYVYGSASNPLPNIVDQSLAMEASGNVTVWIQEKDDWEVLKKIVRVLMVYNDKVEYVHFKFVGLSDQEVNIVRESLQRFMDVWAGNACPRWSRSSVAPFTISTMEEPTRRKRAASPGEYLRRKKKNWELEWVLRN